jgi:hypothetical protein
MESNRYKVQVKPIIEQSWAYESGGINNVKEARTWPGGPDIDIIGTGLQAYQSPCIVTLGGVQLSTNSEWYEDINITSIPENVKSGDLKVTVAGITSNAIPYKIGVEDWVQLSNYVKPAISVAAKVKCANTGEIRDWNPYVWDYHVWRSWVDEEVEWSGNNFSMDWKSEVTGTSYAIVRLEGSISDDGLLLESFDYYKEDFKNDSSFVVWELTVVNLPLGGASHDGSAGYSLRGPEIESHVTKLKYRQVKDDYQGLRDFNIESIDWRGNPYCGLSFDILDE